MFSNIPTIVIFFSLKLHKKSVTDKSKEMTAERKEEMGGRESKTAKVGG